ncbi:hypothetical protein [Streptomyces meridianus]|uniref:ABC transporter permease n=1 Tax=Streptomyces meridianus TaxID=2938945 RepID=A0ABT0X1R5_9ACTN|nr:hypothetical protein [Streptomyces meridianus]MCM2576486.1 hypothetical protein [Streptomyces meridianus]
MTAPLTPHEEPPGDPSHSPPPRQGADGERTGAAKVRQAALVTVLVALSGAVLGALWLWLAPHVLLVSDGKAVYFKNSEGEEAIGADGVFVLLALGFGVLSGALVFLVRRSGGIPIVVGLALGGLLGAVLAWRLGGWFGPAGDVAQHARRVGKGVVFDAPLQLRAKGALLVWPVAALAVHLGLTALFGPRDPEPGENAMGVPFGNGHGGPPRG